MSTERLQPETQDPDSSVWVDEAIWGHRLYDEQTPWFVYLEFLNVAASARRDGALLREPDGFNRLAYTPAHRLYLRNILFNYPSTKLAQITKSIPAEADRWAAWSKEMTEAQVGLVNPDFRYLRDHFASFADFAEVLRLIQSSCLELQGNKRWTSRFVFPFCEEALYEDLDREAVTNDRRFFGRTGELLYLMLCRARDCDRLRDLLERCFFQAPETVWHTILRALQPPGSHLGRQRAGGFLPYRSHPCFDALCRDWIAILCLGIPTTDMVPHLVRLAGLHILRYQQVCARETLGEEGRSYFITEIVAPRKTLVRELAVESYQENNTLSGQAVADYVDAIEDSEPWRRASEGTDAFQRCLELLRECVLWPRKDDKYEGEHNPDDLIRGLKEVVRRRHAQHVGNVHRVYGREVGLVSKRGTNRLRYTLTDSLLRTLVFANVATRLEFSEFLSVLFDRYDVVIGGAEAERMTGVSSGDLDKKAFGSNADRLEQRLASIGLLLRLSDGCAYLVNPYGHESG